jgi:hypothetical protein
MTLTRIEDEGLRIEDWAEVILNPQPSILDPSEPAGGRV